MYSVCELHPWLWVGYVLLFTDTDSKTIAFFGTLFEANACGRALAQIVSVAVQTNADTAGIK